MTVSCRTGDRPDFHEQLFCRFEVSVHEFYGSQLRESGRQCRGKTAAPRHFDGMRRGRAGFRYFFLSNMDFGEQIVPETYIQSRKFAAGKRFMGKRFRFIQAPLEIQHLGQISFHYSGLAFVAEPFRYGKRFTINRHRLGIFRLVEMNARQSVEDPEPRHFVVFPGKEFEPIQKVRFSRRQIALVVGNPAQKPVAQGSLDKQLVGNAFFFRFGKKGNKLYWAGLHRFLGEFEQKRRFSRSGRV